MRINVGAIVALCISVTAHAAEQKKNVYDDPFVQVTSAIATCPVPDGPLLTESEAREQAHWRVERGTSCYQSGRCRLPNSYLYDREIVPRVAQFIRADGRFDDTSVWVEGQRRWVFLKGCVHTAQQAKDLENAVRGVDDVEAVVDELVIDAPRRPDPRAKAR